MRVVFSKHANLTGKNIFRAQKTNFPVWQLSITFLLTAFLSPVYIIPFSYENGIEMLYENGIVQSF